MVLGVFRRTLQTHLAVEPNPSLPPLRIIRFVYSQWGRVVSPTSLVTSLRRMAIRPAGSSELQIEYLRSAMKLERISDSLQYRCQIKLSAICLCCA
jgi:hypothetical protein